MRLKFASLLLTLLVVSAMLGIGAGAGAGSASAASSPALVAPGTYSCEAAAAANEIPPPPPIWELSGKAPSAEEVATANATKPLCPAGQVPSRISTSGVAVPDLTPTHTSAVAGGIGAASDLGAAGEPKATPPCTGANGGCACAKEEPKGCYWYAYNEVEKTAIGMEYATNVSKPHVSSFQGAHSIDQLAIAGGGVNEEKESPLYGNPHYTVEAGWDVDPTAGWGSPEKPHFFVFVNPDYYGTESCYIGIEERCTSFVPSTEAKVTPGATLEPSTAKVTVGVKYTGGNWWIWYGTQWIGYVKGSAWGSHFTQGENEANYGEVFDNEEDPTTQMGEGYPGESADATSMTQSIVTLPGEIKETTGYHGSTTNSALYSIGDKNKEKTEWHFGGEGKDPVPRVTTEGSSVIPPATVEMKGSADPNNLETHYYFEYGPTTSYGSTSPTEPAGSGVEPVAVNAKITKVKPGTTYHYRLVAYNADGHGYGADSTFTVPWWYIQSTQNPHGSEETDEFYGVSCWSASGCDAVGWNTTTTEGETIGLVERWNGSSWEVQSTPKSAGAKADRLESVACRSASECEATGYAEVAEGKHVTLAERWNGTAWSVQSTPTIGNNSDLASVSCPSASECVADGIDESGAPNSTLVELWNGKEWKTQTTAKLPKEDEGRWFESISCPSSKHCTAVGIVFDTELEEGVPLVESWNGSTWTLQSTPVPETSQEAQLDGVSCSATSACTAVGEYYSSTENAYRALIERYNGTSWQLQESPSPVGKPAPKESHWSLDAVSCPTSGSCVAIGSYAESASARSLLLGEEWNGSSWELALPTDRTNAGVLYDQPHAVSCSAALTCTLAGVTWKEKYNTETLAERMWEQ